MKTGEIKNTIICGGIIEEFINWFHSRGKFYSKLKVKFYCDGEPYFSSQGAEFGLRDYFNYMKKGISINKNLYYCDRNFYWLKETPKMIFIEWIPHYNADKTELDQNVDFKELKIKKDNTSKHCLKDWNEGDKEFLIYPWRSGETYCFEPATIDHLDNEIKDCEKWGVSGQYYKNLKIFV